LLKSRQEDARQSQLIAKVIALPGSSQTPAALPTRIQNGSLKSATFSSGRMYTVPDWRSKPWGTAHSCYGISTIRATWDTEELNYIASCASKIESRKSSGVVPEILRIIRSDPSAVPIFLLRHIEDAGRLTHGYRMSKKEPQEAPLPLSTMRSSISTTPPSTPHYERSSQFELDDDEYMEV
jgi:hypothetical protein